MTGSGGTGFWPSVEDDGEHVCVGLGRGGGMVSSPGPSVSQDLAMRIHHS